MSDSGEMRPFELFENRLIVSVDLEPHLADDFKEYCSRLIRTATMPPVLDLARVNFISRSFLKNIEEAGHEASSRGYRLRVRIKHHLAPLLTRSEFGLIGDVDEV